MIKEIIERNREEVDEIKKIYNDFYESAKEDTEGRRLFKSLYQKANDYIECKRRWECLSDIEACKINGERSGLHEILIQAFQEMLEYTEKQGKKHSRKIHLTGIEIILQLLQMSWFPERKILGSVCTYLKHSSGHKIILKQS